MVEKKIYETAFFQLINKLLFTIFVFKSLNKGDNIELYFLYFGLATFITGILSSIRIITKYSEKLKLGNIESSIELIKKSYILFNSSIIGNITNSSIPFMIGYFSSLENVGIYNIADRIKNILIQIINPLSNSIFPRMSKIYKENKTNANRIFINFLFFISGLGVFLLLLLNLNIDFVINYFLKEKIEGIKTIIRVLSFSFLLNILYESFINQYLIINHLHKDINRIKLYLLSSSILIGIPLIFLKGIFGAALTNLIYESLGLIFVINIFNKTRNKIYLINFMIYLEFLDGQGLGNQLWNYASLRSISKKLGLGYKVINPEKFKGKSFLDISYSEESSNRNSSKFEKYYESRKIFNEKLFFDSDLKTFASDFDKEVMNILPNTLIRGLFQSERCFFENNINEFFSLNYKTFSKINSL